MYVIENEAHEQVGKVLNNLRSVHRPDGGWTTNGKVDEQVHDENGNVYFIREVVHTIEGEGPRVISHAAPAWDGEKWTKVKTVAEALPPAPDPEPGDEFYNHRDLRKREYIKQLGEDNSFENTVGDILDLMFKEFDSLKAAGTVLTLEMEDALNKITDIKEAFPIPEEDE